MIVASQSGQRYSCHQAAGQLFFGRTLIAWYIEWLKRATEQWNMNR